MNFEQLAFAQERVFNSVRLNLNSSFAGAKSNGDEVIRKLIGSLNVELYEKHLRCLSGVENVYYNGDEVRIATRYTKSHLNLVAADYIRCQMLDGGFVDKAYFQEFNVNGYATQNVIGIKSFNIGNENNENDENDEEEEESSYVIGAHYDSISNVAIADAPGCNDNGTGVASILCIIQAFSKIEEEVKEVLSNLHNNNRRKKKKISLVFIFFGAEEQGMHGSKHYILRNNVNNNNAIASAIILDTLGFAKNYYGVKYEGTPDVKIKELLELAKETTETFVPDLVDVITTEHSELSDHVSFQRNDIPCILVISADDCGYEGYHRNTDTIEFVNIPLAFSITKAVAAILYKTLCGRS